MPRLFELERNTVTKFRIVEPRAEANVGEESIVIDERSRRSSLVIVEEKLNRLTLPGFDLPADSY